ncbi:acyl carrier protein [Streptomyces sp. NPDC058459]|uniref:acyl carrier protein n=1 Tax=Streptomyces sp. NPDC058459 TaxID=3346508 RepID=UPI0036595FBF
MTQLSPAMILECLSKVFPHELTEDTDIFEAGVDSLVVLRVRALIKQQTGVKVPGHVFFEGRTPLRIAEKAGALHARG